MRPFPRFLFACVLPVLGIATVAHAVPKVLAVDPASQKISASAHSSVQVAFSEPIDPASVNPVSFRVYGRWSGPASGSFAVDGTTVTFTPDRPFFAGEWVTVNLSRKIKNTGGAAMGRGYAWNFWIKSARGTLDLTYHTRITTRQGTETWVAPYGGYAGDLNHDGWCDLTVPCEQTADARIFLNNGAGGYPSFRTEALVPNSRSSPNEGADFNNDGDIDVVFGDSRGSKITVLRGDGTGHFSGKAFYTGGSSIRGVGVVDLNGDGWDDIVTANVTSDNLCIFMNHGDGTFPATGVPVEAGGNGEVSVTVADANNDGLLDVFTSTFYAPWVVIVLLSDGNGHLTAQAPVPSGGHPWLHLIVGDFNGDGNVDAAINHTNDDGMGVLMGNGHGGLGAVQSYPTGVLPFAIDTADIDGDGDLDLVSSNEEGASWTVYENQNGVFVNPRTLKSDQSGSCAVLYDRDNDGDIDLSGFDENGDWIYLYDNLGATAIPWATLHQNHPNPFNPATTIRFDLLQPVDASLSVYDANGAFVTAVANGRFDAGPHEVSWNGTNASGAKVASGVYFYRLASGSAVLTAKMVLIK